MRKWVTLPTISDHSHSQSIKIMDDLSTATCMAIEALVKKQGYAFDTPNFKTIPYVEKEEIVWEQKPNFTPCSLIGNSYKKGEKIDIDY